MGGHRLLKQLVALIDFCRQVWATVFRLELDGLFFIAVRELKAFPFDKLIEFGGFEWIFWRGIFLLSLMLLAINGVYNLVVEFGFWVIVVGVLIDVEDAVDLMFDSFVSG